MKQKYIAMILAFSLMVFLLAGCGEAETAVSSAPETAAPEAFGTTVESAAREKPVIAPPEETDAPGSTPVPSAAEHVIHTEEAPVSPVPRELSQQALFAVAYCDAADQLSYDSNDPLYFWRALGYLTGTVAEEMKLPIADGFVQLTVEDVSLLAHALFADFSGEIPIVTEEDPLVSRGENDTYMIHVFDVSDLTADYTYSGDNSSCSISMTLRGQALGKTLTVTTVPYTGSEAGAAWFPRSISEVTAVR